MPEELQRKVLPGLPNVTFGESPAVFIQNHMCMVTLRLCVGICSTGVQRNRYQMSIFIDCGKDWNQLEQNRSILWAVRKSLSGDLK